LQTLFTWTIIDNEYPETWKDYTNKYGFDLHGSNKQLSMHLDNLIPLIYDKNAIIIDAGKALGYKSDYFGNAIKNKPDIGAIEFRWKGEKEKGEGKPETGDRKTETGTGNF